MPTSTLPSGYRFGPFVLDLRSGDLSENGRRIRLQEKPRSLLIAFAGHPGEVITRTELRECLWPEDTFVDFEDGLNTAMRKLREALGDDPLSPRYIETVRGRGYRFIAQVEPIAPQVNLPPTADSPGEQKPAPAVAHSRSRRRLTLWSLLFGCALVAGVVIAYWLTHGHPVLSFSSHDPVLIADFENETGNPRFDNALNTALTVSLQQSRYVTIYSRLQAENVLRLMNRREDDRITAAVGREICQRENIPALAVPGITRIGQNYVLTAQLFDPSTGAVLRSYSERARSEDEILPALDAISADIRRDLGESRYEIHENHAPLPQVTTSSFQALEDYADGAKKFGRGQVDEAVELYKAAIAADPGFAMAHAALGYACYSFLINRPKLGEQEFRTALSLAGRTTERERAWIEMRYAESEGRTSDALDLYRSYLVRWPDDWTARYSYARLLRINGHAAESIGMYRRLIQQSPHEPATYIELATAYSTLGQFPQSIQAYEKAFEIDPSRLQVANINNEYGFTLVMAGNEAKAEQVFSSLLANPATYPHGQRSLAFLDLYRGRYASARQRLMLALAKSDDPFALARIHYMLAAIADGEGDRRKEIAQLDQAQLGFNALGPKVPYGAFIGQAYARAGETKKAVQILDRIAPIANERIETEVSYLALLKAEVAAARGDANTALEFLKPPSTEDSSDASSITREALAHLDQAMGNREAAIAWYVQFLKGDVIGWEAQRYLPEDEYILAVDYLQKGDRLNAIHWVSELLDQWKNADSNLPLLRKARLLHDQLVASATESSKG